MSTPLARPSATGPLAGLKIIDASSVIAGPFSSTLLADLGADVVKIEEPGTGDALRRLAPHKDGVPLWWKVTNRNKRCITLDLRTAEGKDLLGRLVANHDVLVENFRTGTLDRWGITREWLQAINPRLTILRVTGFGQTGPYRDRPGFARIFEAMSGFTRMCGEEDGVPLHLGYPISDAVGGLFGALGILADLYRLKGDPSLRGQEIDCSVTEAMLRTLEFLAIEYDQLGQTRTATGNRSQYAAPGNIYATRDGKWASIAASTQSIFVRLCAALGLDELPRDPRFADNPSRVRNNRALDAIVQGAIERLTLEELRDRLHAHEVGFSPIYDAADVFADPQFRAREAIVSVPDDELGPVRMQCIVPRFSEAPCSIRHAGPSLGQHNGEVYAELGLSAEEQRALGEKQII
ncbi:CaiB/BaiF CoA transferase family protein [Enterovirga rhinocerotis]|uniref:Crotonobetainyl-CoA:carnitine CoA-transferase CaiB-like acyl-CoA transferase n=1 Tax=Enterovirga rhinocerotis TaxID=1339210 RepID=A0A4R7CAD6_9HYPH|nr:CoA transferase [Enterovirga rhinocerotis]TDR93956.1 crotonobetainyl-CoA:carnitine CoA-transferase CaiB-like acyl-CoA transferase [Enterovirga rhinocerotis]